MNTAAEWTIHKGDYNPDLTYDKYFIKKKKRKKVLSFLIPVIVIILFVFTAVTLF